MNHTTQIAYISAGIFLFIIAGFTMSKAKTYERYNDYLFCWLLTSVLMIWQVVF